MRKLNKLPTIKYEKNVKRFLNVGELLLWLALTAVQTNGTNATHSAELQRSTPVYGSWFGWIHCKSVVSIDGRANRDSQKFAQFHFIVSTPKSTFSIRISGPTAIYRKYRQTDELSLLLCSTVKCDFSLVRLVVFLLYGRWLFASLQCVITVCLLLLLLSMLNSKFDGCNISHFCCVIDFSVYLNNYSRAFAHAARQLPIQLQKDKRCGGHHDDRSSLLCCAPISVYVCERYVLCTDFVAAVAVVVFFSTPKLLTIQHFMHFSLQYFVLRCFHPSFITNFFCVCFG